MAKKTSTPKAAPAAKAAPAKKSSPPPKAKKPVDEEEDEWDEEDEGPEFIEEDLDEMDDEMLAEDEDERPRGDDEVVRMLRETECDPCGGSSTKSRCKIRDMHGCPPDKADL